MYPVNRLMGANERTGSARTTYVHRLRTPFVHRPCATDMSHCILNVYFALATTTNALLHATNAQVWSSAANGSRSSAPPLPPMARLKFELERKLTLTLTLKTRRLRLRSSPRRPRNLLRRPCTRCIENGIEPSRPRNLRHRFRRGATTWTPRGRGRGRGRGASACLRYVKNSYYYVLRPTWLFL